MTSTAIVPAEIRAAAQELMDEYGERIDSGRLEEWLDLFAEDCTIASCRARTSSRTCRRR